MNECAWPIPKIDLVQQRKVLQQRIAQGSQRFRNAYARIIHPRLVFLPTLLVEEMVLFCFQCSPIDKPTTMRCEIFHVTSFESRRLPELAVHACEALHHVICTFFSQDKLTVWHKWLAESWIR